ncbi:MAG: Imm52 family immunity protein [Methylocella sp.]
MMKVIDRVTSTQYGAKAYWERRAETPEALAARFVRTIDSLQAIDPVFALWTCGSKRPKKFETMRDRYAEEVAEGLTKDDWGEPEPIYGYWFGALTRGQARDRSFSLRVHAGSTYPHPFANDITFLTNHNSIPDPAVITYEIFKRALLAIVEAWDPLCCTSFPLAILNLVEKGLYFHETWIQYLCPWLASLVTPPASAIVEHLPNGGLLMSATAQTFDVGNPAHMTVARDIAAAIAPLNALPWEDRARA